METGTGTGVPHLLILEDDAAHRDLILRAFRNDPDTFRLSFAGTIHSAREILERDRPDLILSDWILPDGKGLDILPRTDGFVTVPLIIMTSFGDERLAVEIMKSGAIDYVVKSAAVFRDLPHIARRALADWENIQERKRAEAAAQDSRKRIADIMNFLPDAVIAIDNEGRVIGWNHAIEQMTGIMAADMLGKGDHEHSIPFYGVRRPILIDLVLMDDAGIGKTYDYIQCDNGRITSETFIPGLFGGKGAYLWGTASPLSDSAGNRVGAIEVIRDITERKQSEELLHRREAILETLLNAPADTIALLDRDGIIIGINEEGARRLGGTARSVTGRCAYELLPPEVAEQRKMKIDRVFQTGEPALFDDSRSGISLHNEVYPVFGPDHVLVENVALFARDITDRKKAELALQESEKKYRFLIDNVRDIVWQTLPDLTFTYASPAAETLTGYPPGDLIGTSLFAILTEPSAGIVRQRLRERIEEYSRGDRDLATIFEVEIRKKDGNLLWLEVSSNAVFGPDGTIAGFQGVSRDITDRKRAENALLESEVRYRQLFDSSPDGVVHIGNDGLIKRANLAQSRMFTYESPEEMVGLSPTLLITPSMRERATEIMWRRIGGEEIPPAEYRFIRKDGTEFWGETTATVLRNSDGATSGYVCITRDTTEHKNAEDKIRESESRFKNLFHNMSAGVVIYSPTPDGGDFIIHDVNRAAETIEKVKKDDIVGRSVLEVFPGVREFGLFDVFQRVARTGIGEAFPVSMYRDNRISGWRENYVYKLPSGEVVAIYEDVTEKKQAEERLRESRQILEGILNSIPVRVFWKDKDLTYLGCNAPFAHDAGFEKPGDIIGKNDYAMSWREQAELYQADDRAVIESGNAKLMIEEPQTTPSGDTIYLLTSKLPLHDSRGDVIGVLGTYLDITGRRRVEEELRAKEYQLSTIYRNISEVLFFLAVEQDDRYRFLSVNQPFLDITGLTLEMVVGRYVHEVIPEPSLTLVREKYRQAIQGNTTVTWEEITEYPAGKRWGEVRVTPLSDATGRCTNLVGSVHDITDRKMAEDKLRESEERYRTLLFGAGIGVGYWSTDGTLIFLNDISLKRLRGTEADFIGKNMRELFADAADLYLDRLRKAALSPDPMEYEDEIVLPVGKGWYLSVYTRICRPDGSVMGIQVLSMDITERKQAEEVRKAYETRLNAAMEIGSLAWWEMDLPDGSVRFDDRKAAMLGYIPDRFHRFQDFVELIHPDDYEPTMQAMRDHLGGGKERYFADYRIRTSGGEYRWLRDVGGITKRHPDGSPATVTGIVIDINPSKKADEALRESEERYRTLVEELPDFIIVHRKGELLYVNAAISRMLGKSAESLLHTSIIDYIAPESRETVVGAMEKRLTGIPVAPYTARLLLPDGSTRWVEIRGAGIMFDGTRASFNVLTDITEKKWAEDALYESEKKFRTVADYTYDWEYWVGKDGNFIYVSPSCDRICGYAPEDFYKDKDLLRRIVVDEDRGILASHNENLGTGPDSKPIEFRILTKDGRTVWIGHICQPVFSHEGEYLGRRGSNRDITERKQAEDALRASEVRFRSLIQNSSDIIRILDRDRRILYESASAERILGYPVGFFIGKDPGDYIHPDDLERVRADFSEVMDRKNSGIPTEFRIRNADGSWLWVDAVGTNLLGVPGVDGIVITIRPIQQRKMMENELRENQIRLATAMDMAHLVNWEFDLKTGMFTFNDRFYALYGTSADREGGYLMPAETYVREFVHPDDVAYAGNVSGNVASITDPDYSGELEHRIIRRDGEMRYIIVRFGVIMDETGTVTGTRGANQDITSRKMMESEIRSLNTVLEQRVDQRTNELNRSLQEKELLLREIHHRVKNNLQIIISLLRLQKRQISDKATLSTLMDSESRVRSMALVHEKLYRSKDIEHIDIGDYLKALTQYLFTTYTVEQRRIAFNVVMTDLSLDIQRAIPIGLILNELISNALKHAFPQGRKGEVRITGKKEDNRILIFIDDDGIGFPEGLDWRNTQSLGMHLVMTLIEQVRGTIELTSGAGGTHFIISIPVQGGKGA